MGASNAEMSYGILFAHVLDTNETEGGETNSKDISHATFIPSLFVEYGLTDTVTVGLSFDVSDKIQKN